MHEFFKTEEDWALTALRVVFGAVFFAHGAQKMLGWFGGRGFEGYMTYLIQVRHIPAVFAFLATAAEFFGSIGLIFGLLSRVAAFGIGVNMVVAILLVHIHFGFFMNWNTTKHGEGMEFCLLAILIAAVVMIKGSGALSLDRFICKLSQKQKPARPAVTSDVKAGVVS